MILNTNTRSLVVQAIRTINGNFTSQDLIDKLEVRASLVQTCLSRLQAYGEIVCVGRRRSIVQNWVSCRVYQATDKLGIVRRTAKSPVYDKSNVGTVDNIFKALIVYGHDEDFVHREPAESTHYPPGSPQKVEVMAARVGRGESPYHPHDVKVGASGHESYSGPERISERSYVETWQAGRVMRKAIS
jgi:hypothetical protein